MSPTVTYTVDAPTMARVLLTLRVLGLVASGEDAVTALNRSQTDWLTITGRLDADTPLEPDDLESFVRETTIKVSEAMQTREETP